MQLLSMKLQAFLAIVQHGSVHAAARSQRLTQTAMTRRLAGLEDELKTTLFLRSRRGMELTDAGRALLAYARQAVDLEGEALARIRGSGAGTPDPAPPPARVKVHGPSSVLRARVIPALAPVLAAHPHVAVEFHLSDSESGVDALKAGRADFAVLQRSAVVNEFDTKQLRPERYVLVGRKGWDKRPLAAVIAEERIVDFDPSDRMTYELLTSYGLRDLAVQERHFVNNTDALASLVAAGLAYSVLTSEFAESLIKAGRLVALGGRKHYDFPIALAWYPRKHLPPHFRAIVDAIA